VWAGSERSETIFSAVGQLSDSRLTIPKFEGWVGFSFRVTKSQTLFFTGSSQIIYPSVFDRFFIPKTAFDLAGNHTYEEVQTATKPERNYRLNITYKKEGRYLTAGFSLTAETSNDYLFWRNPPFSAFQGFVPYGAWGPFYEDLTGVGTEVGIEIRGLGVWKSGYGIKYLTDRDGSTRIPLSALHRSYLRWTTPEAKPIKALSFRLVPTVHFYSGFINDIIPYEKREATLVNLKAIGAVKNFNFFYAVENLFDRRYFLRGDLPQPGRSYFFGFNWSLWD